ncbi:MAG: M20/M25/M40 family metallo-hydrolase, partial [Actinomycetota bacterium]|nr:M20/M25/M40 family metallo-hydrolase [Actinomycetota bacterium]
MTDLTVPMGLTDTLVELVDIPSVTGHEGRICTYLAERLLPSWGMEAVERIGNSLLVGRRTGRPIIAVVGHIDTVPEQGQGAARVEDGRLFGLGASDMKAGVAVMVHLLEDEVLRAGPYDLVAVFYDGEEGPADRNGLGRVLELATWLSEAELGVVLEPTDLELQLGCLGFLNARVT